VETPTELARIIRFALSELSGENGHHAFEHLCRELAQARLVSNILPATGPVAGGGDQGRDFETFRTYLAGSLRFSEGFLGLASANTVVFACTLQREDLKAKVKDDVTSICTQGTPDLLPMHRTCQGRRSPRPGGLGFRGVPGDLAGYRRPCDRPTARQSRGVLDRPDLPAPASGAFSRTSAQRADDAGLVRTPEGRLGEGRPGCQ